MIQKAYAIINNSVIEETSKNVNFWNDFMYYLDILPAILLQLLIVYIVFKILVKLMRLLFEIFTAKNLVRI